MVATLGKYLNRPGLLHPALVKAVDGIYGYASEQGAQPSDLPRIPAFEEAVEPHGLGEVVNRGGRHDDAGDGQPEERAGREDEHARQHQVGGGHQREPPHAA